MPRAGLTPAGVVAAGADLADEIGWADLTLARLAERVGVRAPSLYKHVASQADLARRVAALALNEAADAMGTAIQGRAGADALQAAAHALRNFVITYPGRYSATIGTQPAPAAVEDPIAAAAIRGLEPLRSVLRGYDIRPEDEVHALRALRSIFHGFASLQAAGGFQYGTDVDESFDWLITLVDDGLRHKASPHDRTSDDRS